ncbi:MAG TPA: hypothetical protein VNK46_03040 [Nitrospiraceae bacterium]|jgi:hypothetical protein|nr:hypothetical protein [Nitrospiraceae bacterium]
MRSTTGNFRSETVRTIRRIFDALDYSTLGRVYCDEGGDEFWKAKRGPCRRLGIKLAKALMGRLKPGGRSLYVGAGVAEIPALAMETLELGRQVTAYNLRADEVAVLNHACKGLPFELAAADAGTAPGMFDHLWIVSVLNDPERFPHLAALSYGRADPVTFDPKTFADERRIVRMLAGRCLRKLTLPALVTTSTEELVWIAEWCHRRGIPYRVGAERYPTATVGDPVCFVLIGQALTRK